MFSYEKFECELYGVVLCYECVWSAWLLSSAECAENFVLISKQLTYHLIFKTAFN